DTLIAWMNAEPQTGMVSCKLLSPAEAQISSGIWGCPLPILRPLRFPTPLSFLPFFLNFKPFSKALQSFSYASFQDDVQQEVDQPRGAFLLIRKEILDRLGFAFDPRYFILFEDVDLCREVKRLGYKIVYNPSVSCLDYLGRSFLKQPEPWKYLQIGKSFKSYVRKWHSPLHLLWLNLVIPLGFFLRIPKWFLRQWVEKK
ncbi:MAG: glycosyltransferase family 2 protein, partial [Thermodesulfobacteriota bacterium]